MDSQQLKNIIEGALVTAGKPLTVDNLLALFKENEKVDRDQIKNSVKDLEKEMDGRGIELKKVASGFRVQVRAEMSPWVSRLWEDKPPRYSRAFMETLALIVYRQPITRGEIESIRGVAVSSSIVRTMLELEWIKVIGHRDVPGKPALFGTTKLFLDSFNLKTLEELPSLSELRSLDDINKELNFDALPEDQKDKTSEDSDNSETSSANESVSNEQENLPNVDLNEDDSVSQDITDDEHNSEAVAEAEELEAIEAESKQGSNDTDLDAGKEAEILEDLELVVKGPKAELVVNEDAQVDSSATIDTRNEKELDESEVAMSNS